jgi:hypothetical protein
MGNPRALDPGNRADEFSPFRRHYRLAKRHASDARREFTISLADVKHQWEAQRGRCIYTGWKLVNPFGAQKVPRTPKLASLDRRDSSRGYTTDNIQFVSLIANLAKNNFDGAALIEFGRAITKNFSSKT